jgi:hypothetical protein
MVAICLGVFLIMFLIHLGCLGRIVYKYFNGDTNLFVTFKNNNAFLIVSAFSVNYGSVLDGVDN